MEGSYYLIRSQHLATGTPCDIIQWGPWAGVGMVASNRAVHAAMARAGIGAVQPPVGLDILSGVIRGRYAGEVGFGWGLTPLFGGTAQRDGACAIYHQCLM